jgi:hypothetical protein
MRNVTKTSDAEISIKKYLSISAKKYIKVNQLTFNKIKKIH